MSRRRGKSANPYKRSDRFTKQAKSEGYAARSVYKLTEIDKRFQIFKPGQRVVDLGCAPGSWVRYAKQRIGRQGVAMGIDILDTPSLPDVLLYKQSVYDLSIDEVIERLGGRPHVVMSDMAPRTTGNVLGDHVEQIALATRAAELARDLLIPGGHFIAKVFEGEDSQGFVEAVRADYEKHKRVRPEAVRRVSREFFLVCTGRKKA